MRGLEEKAQKGRAQAVTGSARRRITLQFRGLKLGRRRQPAHRAHPELQRGDASSEDADDRKRECEIRLRFAEQIGKFHTMTRSVRSAKPGSSSPTAAGKEDSKPQLGGSFAVRGRKTIAAPATAVFNAWADARQRACWLRGVKLTVRQTTVPGSLQLTCRDDRSDIAVSITARGRANCAVVVNHTKLASALLVAERGHCWKEMLRALKHYVEPRA
jgi:hypothetical protein